MSDSLTPYELYNPWNSPGQNTGMDSLSLLQGIFPTQGSNPSLPHCGQILYQLSQHPKVMLNLILALLLQQPRWFWNTQIPSNMNDSLISFIHCLIYLNGQHEIRNLIQISWKTRLKWHTLKTKIKLIGTSALIKWFLRREWSSKWPRVSSLGTACVPSILLSTGTLNWS